MRDVLGFLALSAGVCSAFAGMHFHGEIHPALALGLVLLAIPLFVAAWRALVPKAAAQPAAPPPVTEAPASEEAE